MVKGIVVSAAIVALILALSYFLFISGGKPIGTDLSVIGKGKPTLVLAYENYSPTGGEALNRLRKIRGDFDLKVNFVVADLGTPDGQAFARRYQLFDGQAMLLSRNGTPLGLIAVLVDEQEFRSTLNSKLETAQ